MICCFKQKLSKLVHTCRNYSLPKSARFLRHSVYNVERLWLIAVCLCTSWSKYVGLFVFAARSWKVSSIQYYYSCCFCCCCLFVSCCCYCCWYISIHRGFLANGWSMTFFAILLFFYLHLFIAPRVCIARIMPWENVCPFVCQSVCLCLSHAGIVSKRLHISSKFFHHRIARHSSFSTPNGMEILRRGPP